VESAEEAVGGRDGLHEGRAFSPAQGYSESIMRERDRKREEH
jgi:hypothetical protein